tara:strand:+ start:22361 stop:23452 length:1092 start_codon:yes stop_codon:yes gene_type:complete
MRHFPIFLDLNDRIVVVSGAGECAVAKLRLLLKTNARILVFGEMPTAQTLEWAKTDAITFFPRAMRADDAQNATLIYAANEDKILDAQVAQIGLKVGVLVNVVDNLDASDFITPAIVDRSPVTVAIGTEGAAPVLARKIKRELEESLPSSLGQLASIGRAFRKQASMLPMGRKRREFWTKFYFKYGPIALAQGGVKAAQDTLKTLLDQTVAAPADKKRVFIFNADNIDPELMTVKARDVLHEADIIIHDQSAPQSILELARREALVVSLDADHGGGRINPIDVASNAPSDAQIMRIIAGDPAAQARVEMEHKALQRSGVPSEILLSVSRAQPKPQSKLQKRGKTKPHQLATASKSNPTETVGS